MRRCRLPLFPLAILLALFAAVAGWRWLSHRNFPSATWDYRSPEATGFDITQLEVWSGRLGGSGCIVQGGKLVYEWGDIGKRYDVASLAKPFYAHFTLAALQEGLIESLDDLIVNRFPKIAGLNAELGFPDRNITFRHLLDQTSGYGLQDPPGVAFGYNDYQTGLLVWLLFRRVYECGFSHADQMLLDKRLGMYLQFEDHPTFQHPASIPGRLQISARDLARFGFLYLSEGTWRGQSILREDLVALALNSPLPETTPLTRGDRAERFHRSHSIGGGLHEKGHLGSHSFFWWLNAPTASGQRLLPDATPLSFLAFGNGGQFTMIGMPELDLIVVWMDAFEQETTSPFDKIGRHLVNRAVRDLLNARTTPPAGPIRALLSRDTR